jgi:hypothetical protein
VASPSLLKPWSTSCRGWRPTAKVPLDASARPAPGWRQLTPRTDVDLLTIPGVVQLGLPAAAELNVWRDLDPLEAGVGDLPPSLEDSALGDRVITWLRVRLSGAARARFLWAGINAVPVTQREHIHTEPLVPGDGSPGQQRRLARTPVLAGSLQVQTREGQTLRLWHEIDDLMAAEPEVPVSDPRSPPSALSSSETRYDDSAEIQRRTDVFSVDREAGVLTFGDGLRGRRLTEGAAVYASYDVCAGAPATCRPVPSERLHSCRPGSK